MKKRSLLSNVLYVVILVALVGFLLVQFEVFGLGEDAKTVVSTILLVIAVLSVAFVEIVFPVIDNKSLLKEKKYAIMVTVKSVLFVGALVVLFLYQPFGVIKNTAVAIIGFVALYFIQFFISLDPKPVVEDEEEEQETETASESAEEYDVEELPEITYEVDGDDPLFSLEEDVDENIEG